MAKVNFPREIFVDRQEDGGDVSFYGKQKAEDLEVDDGEWIAV